MLKAASITLMTAGIDKLVHTPANGVLIEGMLQMPGNAQGLFLFAHGSGSGRYSPRNQYVAQVLHQGAIDDQARFDIGLLTRRGLAVTR
jgi:predicted alpha/beta-hydrolase family hydrolase